MSATDRIARRVEETVARLAASYEKEHSKDGEEHPVLKSMTTFVGGGSPRFWFSAAPEQSQRNYAQVLIEVFDKHDTNHLVDALPTYGVMGSLAALTIATFVTLLFVPVLYATFVLDLTLVKWGEPAAHAHHEEEISHVMPAEAL